jgi:hypothetical protein
MIADNKRYQVFVSSTFQDLQEERAEVMQALLLLDCIPAGMELFPAANEDQWSLIKKVIDDCDYYIVVIAGRYGSVAPDGMSYTEKEYRYALEIGKPILGFVHKTPDDIRSKFTDADPALRKKLEDFRDLVRQKLVRHYENPKALGGEVMQSLVRLAKTQPAVGWVRGDRALDEAASVEILRLRRRIEDLEADISASRVQAPAGTEKFAQGLDLVSLFYTAEVSVEHGFERSVVEGSSHTTWNDIFSSVAPLMIHEASDEAFRSRLDEFVKDKVDAEPRPDEDLTITDVHVTNKTFDTIRIQLRALGLITQSQKPRSIKDTETYWTLTPYGDEAMTRLCAIPRRFASFDPDEASDRLQDAYDNEQGRRAAEDHERALEEAERPRVASEHDDRDG